MHLVPIFPILQYTVYYFIISVLQYLQVSAPNITGKNQIKEVYAGYFH